MASKICEQCNKEYNPKRNDSRFCSSTCKSKYWYDKKTLTVAPPVSNLQSTLKGVVNENSTKNETTTDDGYITTEKKYETEEYLKLKKEENQLFFEKFHVEIQMKKIKQSIQAIQNNNGQKLTTGLTLGTGIAVDPKFKNPFNNILGAAAGFGVGKIINALLKDDQEKEKQIVIAQKTIELNRLNVYHTTICTNLDKVTTGMSSIRKYETRIERLPKKRFLDPALVGLTSFDDKRVIHDKPLEGEKLHVNYTDKSIPITSDKIITCSELLEHDYASFDFKGKWFDFLGQPAINFKEVIHGSPGSGKSNYAIQHAMNLAENFGTVIYVSGEEGFSKTIKDKFVKNKVTSKNIHIANIHSYEDLLKEVKIDIYNFIFIDSISTLHIDAEMLKQFCTRHKNSAIIIICQSTKDGKMRGSNEIIHDVDIEVIVTNGIAVTNKNRFKEIGKEFNVFENF